MANAPKQIAAKIELFEPAKGVYILRLNDMAFQPVALKVAGALPAGAISLVVVTPTDTKMFSLAGTDPIDDQQQEQPEVRRRIPLNTSGAPDESAGNEDGTEEDPMDEALRLAAAGRAEGMGDEGEESAAAPTNSRSNNARKPNHPKVRRRPDTQKADNTPNAACGRCGGSGNVAVVGANNEADEAPCPVCKGSGQIHKFGSRKH